METWDLYVIIIKKVGSRNSNMQKYIMLDDKCTCANTRHYTSEQCCCIPCCILSLGRKVILQCFTVNLYLSFR